MSASLVGSEMCIRDRSTCFRRAAPFLCCSRQRGRFSLPPSDSGHTAPPVSYTHLTLPTICSV
eukprot:2532449-Alexandrium_andersonii.AAC.1